MPRKTKYWFPARGDSWGWGLPVSWQGWAVFAVFIVLVVAGSFIFPPRKAETSYFIYELVLCVLLIVVGWIKGEPPDRRRGHD
jgi:hypothetical protein